jgi:DNA-binding CsgD family transcriptional regulator
MPRLAQFKIDALGELFRQLEYAPAETRRRQMDAAEHLIADIDPNANYPQDFVIFRITGYRPDRIDEPVTFVGQALLLDLLNMVGMLSRELGLSAEYNQRKALTLKEVGERLNIAPKTIQRYRRQGLVCHYITTSSGARKLMCFDDALSRFVAQHEDRIHKATTFSRMDAKSEAAVIQQARELHSRERLNLNQAALRIADACGRAHETIRQLLRRHDRRSRNPIFIETGPLTQRQLELVHRAWKRGIDPEQIARRLGKSKPAIHRAVNRRRVELLQTLNLHFISLPTFELPDADRVILAAPAVIRAADGDDLNEAMIIAPTNLLRREADEASDDALIAAYNLLKRQSSSAIAMLNSDAGSDQLDQIETNLRWAAWLKQRLIARAIPACLRSIQQHRHQNLADFKGDQMQRDIHDCIAIASEAIESVDPARGQRLERIVSFAMDRFLARATASKRSPSLGRNSVASPRVSSAGRPPLVPWHWLLAPNEWRAHLNKLTAPQKAAMELRHGWSGSPPTTHRRLAGELKLTNIGVVRLLRKAQQNIRAAMRANDKT